MSGSIEHILTEQASLRTPAPAASGHHRMLLIAYACGPGRGSEESVGWDTADALARRGFRVTILTRTTERNTCPPASERHEHIDIVCHDNPVWWQRVFDRMGKPGVEAGYLMWMLSAVPLVQSLHRQRAFDSAQHVTYARYWMPSPLRKLDIPWVLGPVGGGESIPTGLRDSLSWSGRLFEGVRDLMRWLGEQSGAVREAASKSAVALANTKETALALQRLGARTIEVMNSAALSDTEFNRLALLGDDSGRPSDEDAGLDGPCTGQHRKGFVSIGRLLDWKGFHLGLEAFATMANRDETYTIIGSGPFEERLKNLAASLGVRDRVTFAGLLPREEVFRTLAESRALVHPSLHESGGFVCLEAMAAGTPVVCVDTGGPGLFVTPDTGYAVPATDRDGTVQQLADAMDAVCAASSSRMGRAAREHVRQSHTMSVKADRLAFLHRALSSGPARSTGRKQPSSSRAAMTRGAAASPSAGADVSVSGGTS